MNEERTYMIEILDNGITFRDDENEIFECKEFSDNGKPNDKAMYEYLGMNLWADTSNFAYSELTNKIKITIKFEKA